MSQLQKRFDELLLEAIDETLSTLGEPVKNYLYTNLKDNYALEKHEIPEKIEVFSKMLHKIFGWGASRIETKLMENLYSKIKVDLECPECNWSKWMENDTSFVNYIFKIRESFINSG